MGTITRTYSPDTGDTILAVHLNTDMDKIYSEFNGNIENANIAAGAAIAASKTSIGTFTDWTGFTPTWTTSGTNPAIGSGTIGGRYTQIGNIVMGQIAITMAGDTTYGNAAWLLTLPVAVGGSSLAVQGNAMCYDNDVSKRYMNSQVVKDVGDVISIFRLQSDGGSSVQAAVPFVWAASDVLNVDFFYEA